MSSSLSPLCAQHGGANGSLTSGAVHNVQFLDAAPLEEESVVTVEVNLFKKIDIIQLVIKALRQETMTETANQLNLFGS